jgi:t-SNARE complex subunit (syntaxin)
VNRGVMTMALAAATLLGAGVSFAQEPAASAPPAPTQAQTQGQTQPQMEQARERLQQIKDRLQLTPEQAEQVRPVFVEEIQQLKAVRDKYKSDDGDQNRRAKLKIAREMRGIQKATDDKLQKILSAQQMDEMKKLREEWRQQMRDRTAQR